MNISPRWIALAAVVSFSLSASAQSDASFAAALGAVPPGLLVPAQLKAVPQAPRQAAGPIAVPELWNAVLSNVLRKGTVSAIPGTNKILYSLKAITTLRDGRQALFAADLIVEPAAGGKVVVTRGIFTNALFTLDPSTGKGIIEVANYETSGSGRLLEAYHRVDGVRSETDIVEGPRDALTLDAAETLEEFEAMLNRWAF